MRAGALRHIVDIEHYVEDQDGAGQPIKDWQHLRSRWAEIHNLRGAELWAAQERFAAATTKITMRWFPGLDSTMRIQHQGVVYDILFVDDVELKHQFYEVTCQTGLVENG